MEAFDLESLEWVSIGNTRRLQNIANRVASNTYGLVIVLRSFINHKVDRVVIDACKTHGVPWVIVDQGYGIIQIQRAMERFLTPTTDT